MNDTQAVDDAQRQRRKVVSAKYPVDRIRLLQAVQARRGDEYQSQTVEYALDRLIEEHFPGALDRVA